MAVSGEGFPDNTPNFTADELLNGFQMGELGFLELLPSLSCSPEVVERVRNQVRQMGWQYVAGADEVTTRGRQLRRTQNGCQARIYPARARSTQEWLANVLPTCKEHEEFLRKVALTSEVVAELSVQLPVAIFQHNRPQLEKHRGLAAFYAMLWLMEQPRTPLSVDSLFFAANEVKEDDWKNSYFRYTRGAAFMHISTQLSEFWGVKMAATLELLKGEAAYNPSPFIRAYADPMSPALISATVRAFNEVTQDRVIATYYPN